MKRIVFPGTFDPVTYGHLEVIKQLAKSYEVLVAIGNNPKKQPLLPISTRRRLIEQEVKELENVSVTEFEGLLIDFAILHNCQAIAQGVRGQEDEENQQFLYHQAQAHVNGIDFVRVNIDNVFVSSSLVRGIALEHGRVDEYVPLTVKEALEYTQHKQLIIGITGISGSGKTHLVKLLKRKIKKPVFHLEFDKLAHEIYENKEYKFAQDKIIKAFGTDILTNNKLDKNKLGDKVFGNTSKLNKLENIIHPLMFALARKYVRGKKGIILFDAALIAEHRWNFFCNNNIILVKPTKERLKKNRSKKEFTEEQFQNIDRRQYTTEKKEEALLNEINKSNHGALLIQENPFTSLKHLVSSINTKWKSITE